MKHALYLLGQEAFDDIYGPAERAAFARRVAIPDRPLTPEAYAASDEAWPEVEIVVSGWGMVPMDEAFLRRFPALKIVLYGAGAISPFATDAAWERGVRITSAHVANAVPVCEYTVAQILCALKQVWQKAFYIRRHGEFPPKWRAPGAFGSTVGLVSLGTIGRMAAERLRQFDLSVVAHDPHFPREQAEALGVRLVSLEELFAVSDVVSCHTPVLKETRRMIRGRHFKSMKRGATFLNTARGAIVDEEEMIGVLADREDLLAILDVTVADPPPPGSPLYLLDNIVLTPHIAGSLGEECRRMGQSMVEELDLYLRGLPLRHEARPPARAAAAHSGAL